MEELTTEMKVAQKFLSATDSEIASQIEKAKKYIDDILKDFICIVIFPNTMPFKFGETIHIS